jgi:hypothetical protein
MAQETTTQHKNTGSEDTQPTAQAPAEVGAPKAETAIQPGSAFSFPSWPSSKPGPRATPAPYGSKSINRRRSEQVAETGYNQETGEKAGNENRVEQPVTSVPKVSKPEQDFLKQRRKQRL